MLGTNLLRGIGAFGLTYEQVVDENTVMSAGIFDVSWSDLWDSPTNYEDEYCDFTEIEYGVFYYPIAPFNLLCFGGHIGFIPYLRWHKKKGCWCCLKETHERGTSAGFSAKVSSRFDFSLSRAITITPGIALSYYRFWGINENDLELEFSLSLGYRF